MQPAHHHHAQPQSPPQNTPQNTSPNPSQNPSQFGTPGAPPGGSGDIVIPQPNAGPAPVPAVPSTETAPRPAPAPAVPAISMSSTQMVIALVLVLVWAGLLLFVRRVLTRSLVAQFADLEKSRGAGTTLYLFLLALGATVIVCSLGSFWTVLAVVVPAAVLDSVLLIVFLFSLGSARASRQRR